ncbi:MAG: Ribonuclease Z, partial [uncultured Phycisphaerae bacterium]
MGRLGGTRSGGAGPIQCVAAGLIVGYDSDDGATRPAARMSRAARAPQTRPAGPNMKLTFLGTGSAFTLANYQSNMLLEDSGKRLLIDCGGDARHAMAAAGYKAADVDALYVSHLHADHIGGIEWL